MEQTVLHENGEELVITLDSEPLKVAAFIKAVSAQVKEDHFHVGNEKRLDSVVDMAKAAINSGFFRPEVVRLSTKKKPAAKAKTETV